MKAAEYGHMGVVLALLEARADVNAHGRVRVTQICFLPTLGGVMVSLR